MPPPRVRLRAVAHARVVLAQVRVPLGDRPVAEIEEHDTPCGEAGLDGAVAAGLRDEPDANPGWRCQARQIRLAGAVGSRAVRVDRPHVDPALTGRAPPTGRAPRRRVARRRSSHGQLLVGVGIPSSTSSSTDVGVVDAPVAANPSGVSLPSQDRGSDPESGAEPDDAQPERGEERGSSPHGPKLTIGLRRIGRHGRFPGRQSTK